MHRKPHILDVTLGDGRQLRVRRWPGKGSPVVLLHGLLDSSEGWDQIAQASQRESVAFDLPGFGGSQLPARPLISAYAEDIAEAMGQLDLRDVTLVGHSLGGAVAAAVCELAPDRVASLVLIAPAGFGRIALAEAVSVPGVRTVAEAVLSGALRSHLVVDVSYRLFVTAGRALPAEVLERLQRNTTAQAAGAVMATKAIVAAGRSRDGFHRRRLAYGGPVRVLWGEQDHLVPIGHAQAVRRALPQAGVHIWEGMGHHPQRERLAQLAGYLETADAQPCVSSRDERSKVRGRRSRSRRPALIAAATA